MTQENPQQRAIGLLQQLGLKEYEAKSFVALTQLNSGTAREVSDLVDVPRTRVYEAMRTLENMGLVDIQHSTPQEFRAVSIDEATAMLRDRYQTRVADLEAALADIESSEEGHDEDTLHEVWSLTNSDGIVTRTAELIDDAGREVVLVVGDERILSEDLYGALRTANDRGVAVIVGATDDSLADSVREAVPEARVFSTGLGWLRGPETEEEEEEEAAMGRLLMVDRSTILASSIGDSGSEKAVFARGLTNGFVVITRRLLATGLDENGIRTEA